MPDHAPETVEARAVRDQVVELSRAHEQRAHGGEPCLENRVGLAAFLVHALGLGPIHLPLVAREIAEYEAQHAERHVRARTGDENMEVMDREAHRRLHEGEDPCP